MAEKTTTKSTRTTKARATKARTTKARPAKRRNVAERAALVYVGATLEARDRAIALVGELRETSLSTLERRGHSARTQLERELRGRRRDVERLATSAKERVAAIA